MKKILFLLMLLMSCFAYSYGYRNTYWGEDELSLIQKSGKKKYKNWGGLTIYYENARMLGQSASIFFTLKDNKLNGICYSVDNTESSRQQLEELFEKRKLRLVQRKYINIPKENNENIIQLINETCFHCSYLALDEAFSYKNGGKTLIDVGSEEKADREIIIADYDTDTQVFIYVGVVPDKICVAYVEKQEDF